MQSTMTALTALVLSAALGAGHNASASHVPAQSSPGAPVPGSEPPTVVASGTSIAGDARRTTGIRLEQEYDMANGRRTPKDFVARNSLELRVDDIARAGEVADAAVQAGATSIDGIRFDLKDRAAVEREALRLAVADARARAEAAATGAGRTIDRILKIEETDRAPVPRPMIGLTAPMRAEAVTAIEPGLIDVRASVTLTASIK